MVDVSKGSQWVTVSGRGVNKGKSSAGDGGQRAHALQDA